MLWSKVYLPDLCLLKKKKKKEKHTDTSGKHTIPLYTLWHHFRQKAIAAQAIHPNGQEEQIVKHFYY